MAPALHLEAPRAQPAFVSGHYTCDANGAIKKRRLLWWTTDVYWRTPDGLPGYLVLPDSSPAQPHSAVYHYDHNNVRAEKLRLGFMFAVLEARDFVDDSYEVDALGETHEFHLSVAGRRVATSKRAGLGDVPGQSLATSVQYYHSDHVGTNTLVTSSVGQVIQEAYMDPFGGLEAMVVNGSAVSPPNPAASVTPYLFTDQHRDAETGLDYFGARYYDSWIGRFDSQDPELIGPGAGITFGRIAGDGQNFNAYSYVLNRPTVFRDTQGLWVVYAGFVGEAGTGGGGSVVQGIALDSAGSVDSFTTVTGGLYLGSTYGIGIVIGFFGEGATNEDIEGVGNQSGFGAGEGVQVGLEASIADPGGKNQKRGAEVTLSLGGGLTPVNFRTVGTFTTLNRREPNPDAQSEEDRSRNSSQHIDPPIDPEPVPFPSSPVNPAGGLAGLAPIGSGINSFPVGGFQTTTGCWGGCW